MNAWLPQASSCLYHSYDLIGPSRAGIARTSDRVRDTACILPSVGAPRSPGISGRRRIARPSIPETRCIAGLKNRLGVGTGQPFGDNRTCRNPCGNFSGTSSLKFRGTKGSIGHTFMVCIHTENQNQGDFYPFVLLEISVLHESPLGHLRYGLTDVPPQPNSPPDNVINPDRPAMGP